jgi:hypothetical protein
MLVDEINIWAAILEALYIDISINPWLFYNNINSYSVRVSGLYAKSIDA